MATTSTSPLFPMANQQLEKVLSADEYVAEIKWEYLSIRFLYNIRNVWNDSETGGGNFGFISVMYINSQQVKEFPNRPHLILNRLGQIGWEMVNHTVNQDNKAKSEVWHYLYLKRPIH